MPLVDFQALARLDGVERSIVAYRNQAPGFEALSGEGARRMGGRYNPARSFPVLYLCTTRPCVVAELSRQAERQGLPVRSLLPRELWEIRAELGKVLDLTNTATLDRLGLHPTELVGPDHRFTQSLGEAAFDESFQAILSPSATGVGQVLAVFPQRLERAALHVNIVEEWMTEADLKA